MYGLEATLPKASGGTSDPVFSEVQRRVYSLNYRIKEYEQKIAEVPNRISLVRGELQDSYGAMGSDQLLGNMLTIGEIANAAAAAQEANGYEAA